MTFYCEENFTSKKQLQEAVKEGRKLKVFSAGLGDPALNGRESICGPWFPEAHKWYAQVEMKDGFIVKVK